MRDERPPFGTAVGPTISSVPEVPIDMNHLVDVLVAVAGGKNYGIVVVSKGAEFPEGER